MREEADWSWPGVVFCGGSRDGEAYDLWPVAASLNLWSERAGEHRVETYARTSHACGGRTVFRFVGRRPDLEDDMNAGDGS